MTGVSRRRFVSGVGVTGLGLLAGCGRLPGQAAPAPTIHRIGYLSLVSFVPGRPSALAAFRDGLQALGYVEGQNLAIETRVADGRLDRVPTLAAELSRLAVELIVATGDPVIRAIRDAVTTMPIVMAASGDPTGTGLIDSLARPGGNITGLTAISPEVSGKRLQLLRALVPGVVRVAAVWNSVDRSKALDFSETQLAAQALGVQVDSLELRTTEDFEHVFNAASQDRPDALITFAEPLTIQYRERIVAFAADNRLPAIYELREFVEAGGLAAYGPSMNDLFRRAARYVEQILKGARPADLPVERPTRFDFVINLRTAQALGLTIPQHVLLQATEIIQ
jgi:putative tryptophan/tyrosine transport system substrate-binding protein